MELAAYLEREDLTLAAFAAMVDGVEESTVARWRDGVMFPSHVSIRLIESATGGKVTYRDFQKLHDRLRGRT